MSEWVSEWVSEWPSDLENMKSSSNGNADDGDDEDDGDDIYDDDDEEEEEEDYNLSDESKKVTHQWIPTRPRDANEFSKSLGLSSY